MSIKDFYRQDFWPTDNESWTDDFIYRETPSDIVKGTLNGQTGDVTTLWANQYKSIGRANTILANMDKAAEMGISDEKLTQYEAEAYFQRASCYARLVSKFGDVVYTTETVDIDEAFTMGRTPKSEIIPKVYEDYDKAAAGLPEQYTGTATQRATKGAALALKARICWYANDETHNAEAYQIASSLLASIDPISGEACNFGEIFTPIAESETSNDLVFWSEMLFTMHNINRVDVHRNLFSSDLDDNNILLSTATFINELYESMDYRYGNWETATGRASSGLMVCTKYQERSGGTSNDYLYEIQPMFGLGELYLIAAATAPDETTASSYLETLRINRGYQVNNMQGMDVTTTLENEWRKEFFAQGQFYYFLKRNNITSVTGANSYIPTVSFSISLPESETDNRRN